MSRNNYKSMEKIVENKPEAEPNIIMCETESKCSCPYKKIDSTNTRGTGGKQNYTLREKIKQFLMEQNYSKENPIGNCNCIKELIIKTETSYCAICGGYEILGDDLKISPVGSYPIPPCPIFQKLKNDENQRNSENNDTLFNNNHRTEIIAQIMQTKIDRQENNTLTVDQTILNMENKSRASEKALDVKPQETKKKSKFTVKKIPKAVNISHERCLNKKRNVPKHMGWLWNEDIPGLKYRPEWRPGAVTRRLNRLYRQLRNTRYLYARKKKKLKQKKDIRIPKPTVIITKKDGEYQIQMEVLKLFTTERLIDQYPYEDEEPYIYKIGRTDQENYNRQLKIERTERRRKRRNNKYLQQTFKDTCKDVCLKAYKQAIGELPIPDPNNPECPCFPVEPTFINIYDDSCSCSDSSSTSFDSDGDDGWVIQFTPPAGKFNPNIKSGPRRRDAATQYSHLDFKVKILDRNGKPLNVPRFFIGPDGKEYCSDLGGFMGPDGKWLVIGVDGTIGPDGKWIPYGYRDADGNWVEFGEDTIILDENKKSDDKDNQKGADRKVEPIASLIYMPKITLSTMCPMPSMPISCMQPMMSCQSVGQTLDACHPSWVLGSRGPC